MGVIAIVVVGMMGAAAMFYTQNRDAEKLAEAEAIAAEQAQRFERSGNHTLGPKNAKVTLVEFFDPECESCKAVHPMVKEVLKRYPKSVRLVLRYMPLHANSVYAATALEAAAEQGEFWPMLDTLYHYQPIWGSHQAPRPELIPGYADELGLDMEAFQASMANPDHRSLIERDKRDGVALGVKATPTFFVNGRPLLRLNFSALIALIEDELGR